MTAPAASAPVASRLPTRPARTSFVEGVITAALSPEGLILFGPACMTLALGRGITRWTGLGGLVTAGIALLVIAGAALVVAWARPRSRMCGRVVAVHTHASGDGEQWITARHEAGHYHVTRAVGGKARGAVVFPDGSGVTLVKLPRKVTKAQDIAVDVAGHVAAGTSRGCDGFAGSDFDQMRQVLATVPPGERAALKAKGYAIARRHVHGLFSPVPSLAKRLHRDKQIGTINC